MGVSYQCPECNFYHPPTAPGQCPMARSKNIKQEAEQIAGNELMNLSIDIQELFLKKVKTIPDNTEKMIFGVKVKDFIRNLN